MALAGGLSAYTHAEFIRRLGDACSALPVASPCSHTYLSLSLSLHTHAQHKRYLSKAIGSEPPHIFAVADRMYRLLVSTGESQAIIVSGPSGSGKTETCKYVLRHLAYVSKHIKAAQAEQDEPRSWAGCSSRRTRLLEAFGNAETTLNKNSSRFGKFVQVIVSRQGAILGASIQTYLLETTRVVQHAPTSARTILTTSSCYGASSSERKTYQLESDPNKYAYLRSASGSSTKRRGEDPEGVQGGRRRAGLLGVDKGMKTALFQTLSGLLSLGSVRFQENPNGDSTVMGLDDLKRASRCCRRTWRGARCCSRRSARAR